MSDGRKVLEAVAGAIRAASRDGPIMYEGASILSGHSGGKILGALQRLPSVFDDEQVSYLEIGVFQGLTLLSVAGANPACRCYGVDNFAYFDEAGENRGIVRDRIASLDLANVSVIDADYEDALECLPDFVGHRKVGVLFIDGPHDYRSQLMCLALAAPYLHSNAVVVVDDANYPHVRQANRDFLRTWPEFRLMFEAYTAAHPAEMRREAQTEAKAGWWNGLNVIVRDPLGILSYGEPPTERSRILYENGHLVHTARLAELAPGAIRLADALLGGRLPEVAWRIAALWRAQRRHQIVYRERSRTRNTYSAEIAGEHWHWESESEEAG